MRYVGRDKRFSKFRLLISGFSNSGKTHSLRTFIYGPYDPYSDDALEQQEAYDFASAQEHTMRIISCPGETGYRSLPPDDDFITSRYPENEEGDEVVSAKYSRDAISIFDSEYRQAQDDGVHILCLDGISGLYDHLFNRITEGEYLSGANLSYDSRSGKEDPYRSARFYSQAHATFGNYLFSFYNSNIPIVVATCWEDWQAATTDSGRPGAIQDRRYLWPALPGAMATRIVGRFDARVSARLEDRCFHAECEHNPDRKKGKLGTKHHVWQFMPSGDVMGVAVKGLKVTKEMQATPFIHQNWYDLQGLIEVFA